MRVQTDKELRKFVLSRDDYTCQKCGYIPKIHDLSEEFHNGITYEISGYHHFDLIVERILLNPYTVVLERSDPHTPIEKAVFMWYYDERLEVDHITPVHLGGETEPVNLQTLCKKCHSKKTAKELWNIERERFRTYMRSLGVGVES